VLWRTILLAPSLLPLKGFVYGKERRGCEGERENTEKRHI